MNRMVRFPTMYVQFRDYEIKDISQCLTIIAFKIFFIFWYIQSETKRMYAIKLYSDIAFIKYFMFCIYSFLNSKI